MITTSAIFFLLWQSFTRERPIKILRLRRSLLRKYAIIAQKARKLSEVHKSKLKYIYDFA
jgi:hypothetical protein